MRDHVEIVLHLLGPGVWGWRLVRWFEAVRVDGGMVQPEIPPWLVWDGGWLTRSHRDRPGRGAVSDAAAGETKTNPASDCARTDGGGGGGRGISWAC